MDLALGVPSVLYDRADQHGDPVVAVGIPARGFKLSQTSKESGDIALRWRLWMARGRDFDMGGGTGINHKASSVAEAEK